MTTIDVERLEAITLEPGDVLIVTLPEDTTMDQHERIVKLMEGKFPGHEILVKTANVGLDVARAVSPPA